MPPKLKRISGSELIKIFSIFSFFPLKQEGSHVKLRRLSPEGHKQTLTIPLHDELDRGTLRAIMRQASKYIPEEKLFPHFYTE
ncbi:MAG: type II toxin-antitoxin system HicA family toxin [Deltaproteobacteria bacterium]|nr:type II toxin-antitoxin system HicA family toxin [Deltaproteobacteria bacterium]